MASRINPEFIPPERLPPRPEWSDGLAEFVDWKPPERSCPFELNIRERGLRVDPEWFGLDLDGCAFELPPRRARQVQAVHQRMRRSFPDGIASGFYSPTGDGAPTAEVVVAVLKGVAYNRAFPPVLRGCSYEYLIDRGIVRSSLKVFGDSVFWAMREGAYMVKRAPEFLDARRTRKYIRALAGPSGCDSLHVFALDVGFSSWFWRVWEGWDFAFAVIHDKEHWMLLLCGTDMD